MAKMVIDINNFLMHCLGCVCCKINYMKFVTSLPQILEKFKILACLHSSNWFSLHILKSKMSSSRVEILHMSKFKPGTVDKNSSTIGLRTGRNRTYMLRLNCLRMSLLDAA